MGALHRLQSDFQRYLIELDDGIKDQVKDSKRVSAEVRLGIYADAYRLRLLEALETDYVALRALTGKEGFDKIGRAYIDATLSTHFSIRYYGDRLSHFLAITEPYGDSPWLSEVAAFEWALTLAFDAADDDVATEQGMVQIQPEAWPHIHFIPHASVQRLDLRWNVVPIWKAAKDDNPLPAPEASEHPQPWVIWRQELKNYYRSLEVDEGWALDGLLKGETFSAICGGLCEWVDEQHTAVHAAGLLKRWLLDGLIREIQLPEK